MCSWEKGKKDLGAVTDVEYPLCVALGPSLDWFFGYKAIGGQLKLIRRNEKGPGLKHGSFYKQCRSAMLVYSSTKTSSGIA